MIGITSLEDRRIRGNMIEVYKLLAGKEKIDYKQFSTSQTHHIASEDTRSGEETGKRQNKIRHKESSSAKEWSMDGIPKLVFQQKS